MPKISSIRPVVSIQYGLVTDRQTDGQTERQTRDDSICRADMASSGKQEKISVLVLF